MNALDEYEIVQNDALSGLALWSFALEYYDACQQKRGSLILYSMLVLPMVYHESTLKSIHRRSLEGGLFRAVADDRSLSAGLQERMEAMADQTFAGLNLCFASNLLSYDPDKCELYPKRRTPPYQIEIGETREIRAAAKRLGYWFATVNIPQLCSLLKVRF